MVVMRAQGGLFQWWLNGAPRFGVENCTGGGGVAEMMQKDYVCVL